MYDLNAAYDLLFVLSHSLNGEQPNEEKLRSIDLKNLYMLSKKHSLSSCVYISVEPYLVACDDSELVARWRKEKNESTYKQLQFDLERETICSHLSDMGCWYMCLKGVVIKELYANPAMREMSDNDILFDENFATELKNFMVSRGYEARFEIGKDDVYTKEPFYNFEMHRMLVDSSDKPVFVEYYKDIKNRLVASDSNPCELNFTDEDFYIYMTLHEYNHYVGGGTGLRAFVDTYVFLKAKSDNMNWDYIFSELEKLGISGFEKKVRELSRKLLSCPQSLDLSAEEKNMLTYVTSSGTYGTRENFIENDLKSQFGDSLSLKQKIKYFIGRIFLKKSQIKSKYPWARKHPILLPLAYMHRIFICGVPELKRIIGEVNFVLKK